MRTAFIRTLEKLAETDPRIWLVVGDLGYSVIESFRERFPDRYLNAGVAEQNMTGIAAGLALSGKVVFTYSIANFPTLRCLEQIRNDVCYHNLNVKIVSVGGGFAYGTLGVSHYGIEDLAVLRSLPGMTVVAPGDPVEAEQATRAIARRSGPCYLRLGKAGEPVLHSPEVRFELGKAIQLREGSDLTLISTGAMLSTTVQVAERLAQDGIAARLLSMHTLKPLDEEAVRSAARDTSAIVTIEEHSLIGGLGGAVAEVLAEENRRPVVFKRIGIPSENSKVVGGRQYMRSLYSLDVDGILATLKPVLKTKSILR
ncbi:MAG: transketolase [Acidobacteria bacterium]|nr:transketolase [Acidobacteriota bacterium]